MLGLLAVAVVVVPAEGVIVECETVTGRFQQDLFKRSDKEGLPVVAGKCSLSTGKYRLCG